ncbi:class I SAM-dependent methyltransferase [Streptomyces sp. NPDC059850]|uniref:class I SAM-dependent methyltransferase n=1 Tax=Streptomyces sp. NPDC059850 TaxID=3346970 RepID=UPI00366A4A28
MGEHYQNLASTYDDNWVYSPAFVGWMSERIASALELSANDRMADIGCGTGLFAGGIAEALRPHQPVLCVDPSAAMLDQLPSSPALSPLRASAEEIADQTVPLPYERLDAMWLKESVHHVTDPATTLRGLARLLAPGGRLLVAMLPPRSTTRCSLKPSSGTRSSSPTPLPSPGTCPMRGFGPS